MKLLAFPHWQICNLNLSGLVYILATVALPNSQKQWRGMWMVFQVQLRWEAAPWCLSHSCLPLAGGGDIQWLRKKEPWVEIPALATAWLPPILLAGLWPPATSLWVARFLYSEQRAVLAHCSPKPVLKPVGRRWEGSRGWPNCKQKSTAPKSRQLSLCTVSKTTQAVHLLWDFS